MGKTYTAVAGDPVDRLVASAAGGESVVRTRSIAISDESGRIVRTISSADDPTDIREKIQKAGYRITSETGSKFELARGPMSESKKWSIGCLGIFMLAILSIVVSCSVQMSKPQNNGPKPPTAVDARIACHDLVSKRLKAPSTAKFDNEMESQMSGTWTATGTVDSQNGFGAMIRGNYTCSMTFNPERDSFSGTVTIK